MPYIDNIADTTCWFCGRDYVSSYSEECPNCGYYSDDNPNKKPKLSPSDNRIVNYIKSNPNSDGIDISHGLDMDIATTYRLLASLENRGHIRVEYVGINRRYEII